MCQKRTIGTLFKIKKNWHKSFYLCNNLMEKIVTRSIEGYWGNFLDIQGES